MERWLRLATVGLPVGRPRMAGDAVRVPLDPLAVTGVALMFVLLLGALSAIVSPKFLLSILFLAPIMFAAVRGGVTSGLVTAAASTLIMFLAPLTGPEDPGWHDYWNAGSRLAVFLLVVLLLTRSQELNHQLLEQTSVLALEVERRAHSERISVDEKEVLQLVAGDRPLAEVLEALTGRIEQWQSNSLCAVILFETEAERPALVVAPRFPEELRRGLQRLVLAGGTEGSGPVPPREQLAALQSLSGAVWEPVRQLAARFDLCPSGARGLATGRHEWIGVIALFAHQRHKPVPLEGNLFDKARDIAAIAIERTRLIRELRRVSELVIDAQEAERRRIARELHDGVNQILSSAAFRIGMVEPQVPAEAAEARAELSRVKALLTRGIDEIHRISEDLRPSELDALGLVPAIRSLCREFQRKTRLSLRFQCDAHPRRLSGAVELTVYRIVQESLTNIEKHAGATRADVRLNWNEHQLDLGVEDNGCGIGGLAEWNRSSRKSGMGLLNMRERTAFLGGQFSIQSNEGVGTRIAVRIPLDGQAQIQKVA
jgi:signal transduction histidine kinase